MLSRLVCLLALSSLCLSSPIGDFERELKKKKKGLDVEKIHEEFKRESEKVEEKFAGKETQKELADLHAAYITSTNGTNEVETEMNFNGELSEDLIEGNIILTPEQRERFIDHDAKATRQRRQADTNLPTLWSEEEGIPTIPYSYADGFSTEDKKIITDSLEFWASRTCIIFRPANETDNNFIEFNHSTTCSSYIGMKGGKQELNLAPGYFSMRIITHELSHAFGTKHVHSRYDRDDYITLKKDNIIEGSEFEFEKEPYEDTYGIPYEFGSLMHYSSHAYAIDETQPTIKAKDEYSKYQNSMGSPLASFYDVLLINRMYKCTDKCKKQISCENNGVQHGSDCDRCFCPKGWAGDRCKERPSDANVIELTDSMEIILEVGPAAPGGYAEKLHVIEVAPVGKRIKASVKLMEKCPHCELYRFFEIIPTKDTRINGIQFYGKHDPTPIESDANQMLVWMYNRVEFKMLILISFTPV